MAFKMKGFPMINKPYNKNIDYKPQTQMTDEELAEKKNIKDPQTKKPGLFSDMSGDEMKAYIEKIEALGDKATDKQKEKAEEYRYYMDTEKE